MTMMTSHNTSIPYVVDCKVSDFIYDHRIHLVVNMASNIAFNFVLSIVAILLNGMISYVMLIHAKYRTPSYFLLLNNSILDTVFPMTLVSWNFILLQIMDYDTTCVFINTSLSIGYVCGSFSMIIANMMATDRSLAIFKPFFYHQKVVINYRTYGPYIFAGWLVSVSIVGASLLTPDFVLFFGFAALTLTFTIVYGSYVTIRIHYLVREINEKTDYPSLKQRARQERRRKHEYYMNRLTISMIVVLLISYVPFTIYSVLLLVAPELLTSTAYAGVLWVYTFIYLKSLANPLLFCISMTTLRRDIGRCVFRRNTMIHSESSKTAIPTRTIVIQTPRDEVQTPHDGNNVA